MSQEAASTPAAVPAAGVETPTPAPAAAAAPAPAAAPAAPAPAVAAEPVAPNLTLGQRLRAALNSNGTLVARNDELTGRVKQLEGETAKMSRDILDKDERIKQLEGENQKLSAAQADVEEVVSSLGFPAAGLPKASEKPSGGPEAKEDYRAKYNELLATDAAAAGKFYLQHEDKILS